MGLALVLAASVALTRPAEAASLAKCTSQIEVEGDNLDGNLRKNFTELKNVTITGCDARIDARLARFTKLDFEDSRWTFEGNVQIRMDSPQGSLSSDQAIVSFRNNQIDKVTSSASRRASSRSAATLLLRPTAAPGKSCMSCAQAR